MKKLGFSLLCLTSSLCAQGNFQANYTEALQKSIFFFDAQRSGLLGSENRVDWRASSGLLDAQALTTDGASVDLSGGYYDAGDNMKYGFPLAFTTTLLAWAIVEFKGSYISSSQLPYAKSNLKWATDYLLKTWHPEENRLYAQVGNTNEDHDFYYLPFETLDMAHTQKNEPRKAYYIDNGQYPGSDLAGSTAAALAAASIVFREEGETAYADELLNASKQIFNFGKNNLGIYSDSIADQGDPAIKDVYNSFEGNSFSDKLLQEKKYLGFAAAWIGKATNDLSYWTQARNYVPAEDAFIDTDSSNWADNSAGTYILLSSQANHSQTPFYSAYVRNWLNEWQNVQRTPEGLIFYSDEGNLSYVANMCFLAMVYSKYISSQDSAYAHQIRDFVVGQVNYILGDNDANRSYLIGYGTDWNWPRHIHHPTAQGGYAGIHDAIHSPYKDVPDRHIDFGALVGGPALNDQYIDDRENYQKAESACDYVAGIQGALAGLNELFPGVPLINFPDASQPQTPSTYQQFFVNTYLYKDFDFDRQVTLGTLTGKFYNHSFWPARVIHKTIGKIFLTLSSLPPGKTLADVEVYVHNMRAPIHSYDESRGIYYVNLWFTHPLYPGGIESINNLLPPSFHSFEVKMFIPGEHDFSLDWSLQNATLSGKMNVNIPLYGNFNEGGPMIQLNGNLP